MFRAVDTTVLLFAGVVYSIIRLDYEFGTLVKAASIPN